MQDLKTKLIENLMSEKEAGVYLAMLELGPASVQDIAKKAEVNRATTYVILEALKKRGLVTGIERDKKNLFAAESPERILGMIAEELNRVKNKEGSMQEIIPSLMAIFKAVEDKPRVRYYEGEGGIKSCREAQLELARSCRFCCTYIHYDKNVVAAAKVHEKERLKMSSGRLKVKILYSIEDGVDIPMFCPNVELKQLPKHTPPFHGELNVFDNFVILATAKTKPIGVILESGDFAGLCKSFFELLWNF
ncbi:MAG: helix-turn-helix domain-containing protein [Patescibacteria group bacterium]